MLSTQGGCESGDRTQVCSGLRNLAEELCSDEQENDFPNNYGARLAAKDNTEGQQKATGGKQLFLVAQRLLLAHSLRQFFAGGKAYALGSRNLDFLGTIARVDSLAGGAGAYLEGPEAYQAYLVP